MKTEIKMNLVFPNKKGLSKSEVVKKLSEDYGGENLLVPMLWKAITKLKEIPIKITLEYKGKEIDYILKKSKKKGGKIK